MTVNEYNHVWYPLYANSNVFISKLDDALTKAGPEAVKQAKCLGWTPEMQEYILHAIEAYQASIREQVNVKKEYITVEKESEPTAHKRAKYMPRVNAHRGENRIQQSWLTDVFGDRFELIWNGHNHFAKDRETDELFYIFKKDKFLLSINRYCHYSIWKKIVTKPGMEYVATTYFESGFDELGTKILVLGKDMQIPKGE